MQVERQLKVRRETQARSSAAPPSRNKGKGVARAPFGELHLEPLGSSPGTRRRPPTPYHPSDDLRQSDGLPPSDDLEDMYFDPEEYADKENTHRPLGKLELVKEMEEEENLGEELEEEPLLVDEPAPPAQETRDPRRTPRPHHVADIQPLPSPFSPLEDTPRDRDHANSPPSSPSPVKKGATTLPLLSTVKKGSLSQRTRALPTPFTSKSASVRAKSSSMAKEKHATSETTLAPSTPLYNRLPKRPAKRSTTAAAPAPTVIRGRKAVAQTTGKGKQREEVAEIVELSGTEDESTVNTPTITRKRKAPSPSKAKASRKRLKVEVVVPPPPHARRKTTKPTSSTSRAKGKGAGTSAAAKLADEDSVCAPEHIAVDVRMLISVQVGRGAGAARED